MPQKLDLTPIDDDQLDLTPLDLTPIDEPAPSTIATRKPSRTFLESINEPMLDLTPYGKAASEYITTPTLSDADSYWLPRIKGFIGGATEGLSNVLSSFTSPLNLATMGAMGGAGLAAKQGLPTAARGLSLVGRGLSAPVAAHGAVTVLNPEASASERLFGLAETAGGLAGMKAPLKPKPEAKLLMREPIPEAIKPEVVAPEAPAVSEPVAKPESIAKPVDPQVADILKKFGVEPQSTAPEQPLLPPASVKFNFKSKPRQPKPLPEQAVEQPKKTYGERLEAVKQEPFKAQQEIKNVAAELEAARKLPPGPEKDGIIRELLGFNKALLTSFDLSAPGRQGKALILNKAWWTSWDDMVKAWKSPEAAKAVHDSIVNHPSGYFKSGIDENGEVIKSFAERVGLDLAEFEEAFNYRLRGDIEKYTGIAKSSRAHTAFLNKLRSDQFVSFMDQAKKAGMDPENNIAQAKAFATFLNDATGRGSLNIGKWKLERNARELSDVFFAPKNMAGQIRTWNTILNPVSYAKADPILRKQALRSLFAVAGLGLGAGEVARLAGATVSNDPTNSDFRKIKVGDTRIDMFGGYQQFPVAAMKLILGRTTSPVSGKTRDLSQGILGRQSVVENFFVHRLAPLPSFVWAWMSNREFDGEPFEVKKALFERTLPIALSDIAELAQEEPELAVLLAPATITGLTGAASYTR